MYSIARPRATLVLACVLTFAAAATGQTVTVDALIAKVITEPHPQPYTLTADFNSRLTVNLSTGRIPIVAVGTLFESRAANGDPRTRKATITRLDIPLLLRPFSNSMRTILTNLIESEQKPGEFIPTQDIFILEERSDGRYVLGGVRQDIVTEFMTKYNQQVFLKDATARRAFAKWLFAPSQRHQIVRPAPGPYSLQAMVDDTGLVHQVTLWYDWGKVGSRLTFVMVGGRPFWRELIGDGLTDIPGLGRVDGVMVLQVTNHCLNCQPR
jgi:hypothetical protein